MEWSEEQEREAEKAVAENSAVPLQPETVRLYEKEADSHWNHFYQTHQRDFFKDRHWLFTEFTELLSGRCADSNADATVCIFEIGCGVGNTIFPILQMNTSQKLFVYGCDFSSVAIDLLRGHESYDESRCHAFVQDATAPNWDVPFAAGSIDLIILIFTLSAIDPSKSKHVIEKAFELLAPGGLLLFRDYGRHDMAQLRFKTGHCLGDNFYVRGDGTRAYFFTEEELDTMFITTGFQKKELFVDRRLQVNRGKKIRMYRIWIQAKYQKPVTAPVSHGATA